MSYNITMYLPEYFPPDKINANHNRMFHLAKGMASKHNVTIVCPGNSGKYEKAEYKGLHIIRFPQCKIPLIGKIINTITCPTKLRKALKLAGIKQDILWYNSTLGYKLSKSFTCKKIYDVMGIQTNEIPKKGLYNRIKILIHKHFEKVLYKNSSTIVTINEKHKRILEKRYSKKIYVLRDAVEYHNNLNKKLYAEIVSKYRGKFVLFIVASFNRPRFTKAMDALVRLPKKIKNLQIVIVGEGKYRKSYEDAFIKNNVEKSVDFVGFQSGAELNSYIKRSDLCFSDVFLDGFPYKAFEYMHFNKVPLVEESEGVRELLEDGVNALLYNNPEEFEFKAMKIYKNPRLRKILASKAKEASNKHTWKQRDAQINKILDEVMHD